jgi:hypothetical protein
VVSDVVVAGIDTDRGFRGRDCNMGNTRAQDRRRGVKRPGPAQRAHLQSPLQPSASLVAARENAAERQRQCRARKRHLNLRSEQMALLREGGDLVNPGRRDVLRVSTKICSFIVAELENGCAGPRFQTAVLEAVLRNNAIAPHLPEYYSSELEAKATHSFIQSYKKELQLLKNPTSAEKLVRKTTLLEAAVNSDATGVRALSRVLGTNPQNISSAIHRRRTLESNGSSIFKLAERRKRDGVLSGTRELVIAWWTSETRVSPNKKDVTRKRLGPKMYDQHATHLLLESQVCDLNFFLKWT